MQTGLIMLAQQAAPASQGNPLVMLFPIVVVVLMFFFLFRTQRKEAKRRQQMLDEIKTGDRVITAGGIHGVITNVKDKSFIVKIADNVKVEVAKSGVNTVLDQDADGKAK